MPGWGPHTVRTGVLIPHPGLPAPAWVTVVPACLSLTLASDGPEDVHKMVPVHVSRGPGRGGCCVAESG